MDSVQIESVTPGHVPLVLQLIRELAAYERMSDQMIADESMLYAALFGEHPAAEAVIASIDNTPVGFALYFYNFSTFKGKSGLYLEDLYVRPEFRGRGAGKALLSYLARLAHHRGCGRLEWAVLDWNTPAIDFYESLGARAMDEWTVFRLDETALKHLSEQYPDNHI